MTAQQGAHPVRSVSYAYDTVDQLTGETQSEATLPAASTRASTFAYDAMGNRTSHSFAQSVNGGAVSTTNIAATHNRLNQVTAQSSSVNGVALTGTNFVYDASGNMTAMAQSNGGSTYLYDDADRLVSITQKDTATGAFTKKSEYVYDGDDRRVVSREYSWDATLNNNVGGWNLTEEKRRVYGSFSLTYRKYFVL